MLYDRYAEKIRRYAQIRDNILRYKIPIICTLAAIIVAWSGFLITKGIITEQISGDSEYVYGDTVSFKAKALFSDVVFEYSSGGEWSAEVPVLPGEYQVRAVSNQSFGRNNYSDTFSFVINKKQVTLSVKDHSVEWKDIPEITAAGLVKGDVLQGANVTLSGIGVGESVAHIDGNSAVIVNKDGKDMTAAYTVTASDSTVNVVPRSITVVANSVSKEYDGKPVRIDGYTVESGSIWQGHVFDLKLSLDEFSGVGSAIITAESPKVTENGVDVTANYRIDLVSGTASITPRKLTLSTSDLSKEYDGYELRAGVGEYSVGGSGLADGDTLNVTYRTYLVDVGSTVNAIDYYISGNTEDVRSCYDITENFGTLTVTKRKLTMQTGSAQAYYSGDYIENNSLPVIVSGSLVLDHYIALNSWSALRDVERDAEGNVIGIKNDVGIGIWSPSAHSDMRRNYDITWEYGTLTVLPRKLTISLYDKTTVYNGMRVVLNTADYSIASGMLSDHYYEVYIEGNMINANDGENYTVNVTVLRNAKEDVTNNFELDVRGTNGEYSKLTIKKRPLRYSTVSDTWEYDGNAHTNDKLKIESSALASGHSVSVQSASSITNVLYDGNGNVTGIDNVVSFKILDANGKDVTVNYDISLGSKGRLVVTPRAITVISGSGSKTYDGTPLTVPYADGDGLVLSHNIKVLTYSTMTNVIRASYNKSHVLHAENVITFIIVDKNGADVTANYCYGDKGYGGAVQYGTLIIYPRHVEIISESGRWTYDRASHSANGYTVTPYENEWGILSQHRLNEKAFSINNSMIGVGNKENVISINSGYDLYTGFIFDGTGADVTENYDISLVSGVLVIEPIVITITPDYVGDEYDAQEHFASTYSSSGKLLDGDIGVIYARMSGSGIDYGTYSSNVSVAVVMDEFGVGVWDNGKMTHYAFVDSTRPMYVMLSDGSYLRIYSNGRVVEVSSASGALNYTTIHKDLDGDSSDLCNYSINAEAGVINIRKRKITITCESKTETYYEGKVLTSPGCRISNGTAAEGHTFDAIAFARATEKGVAVENTVSIEDIIITNSEGENITEQVINNYDIKIISGWLLMV